MSNILIKDHVIDWLHKQSPGTPYPFSRIGRFGANLYLTANDTLIRADHLAWETVARQIMPIIKNNGICGDYLGYNEHDYDLLGFTFRPHHIYSSDPDVVVEQMCLEANKTLTLWNARAIMIPRSLCEDKIFTNIAVLITNSDWTTFMSQTLAHAFSFKVLSEI